MFEPIHYRENQAYPKPPSPPPCMELRIIYAHFPAMGCPKPVRDRYERDGDAIATYVAPAAAKLAGLRSQTSHGSDRDP